MREQIDKIQQDKEWLVCVVVFRMMSASKLIKKGKMLELPLLKPDRIVWHLLMPILMIWREKFKIKLRIRGKGTHCIVHIVCKCSTLYFLRKLAIFCCILRICPHPNLLKLPDKFKKIFSRTATSSI